MAKIDLNYINGSYTNSLFSLTSRVFSEVNCSLTNKFRASQGAKVKNSVSKLLRKRLEVIPYTVNQKTLKTNAEDSNNYYDLIQTTMNRRVS